jgi:hypothetical protein
MVYIPSAPKVQPVVNMRIEVLLLLAYVNCARLVRLNIIIAATGPQDPKTKGGHME